MTQISHFSLHDSNDFQCCDNCLNLADVVSHCSPDDVWCSMCFDVSPDGEEIPHPQLTVCQKWESFQGDDE